MFEGTFTASREEASLSEQWCDCNGVVLDISHPYAARRLSGRVVAFVPGTVGTRLHAVVIDRDGTV